MTNATVFEYRSRSFTAIPDVAAIVRRWAEEEGDMVTAIEPGSTVESGLSAVDSPLAGTHL